MMNRPNIIVLTIDTLRADMLHCYGHNTPLTPNIDRLAASGIRFEQAISGGSWTQAAFPVIMTSSYAAMYGGCLGRLAAERPSPVETLAAHDYKTAGFSTNPHLSRATGYDRGFDEFNDLNPHEVDPRLRRMKGGQRLFLQNPLFHHVLQLVGNRMRPARLYSSAAEVTDNVCRWLESVKQPFFTWIHYMDVHWPYYLEETLTHPRDIAQAWRDLAIMNGRSNFNGDGTITAAQRKHFVELYEQSLQYLDDQIGRLMGQLEKLGYDSNTIVILLADHGDEFLDHGRWGHWESNLYDEIIRVPLIIRMPDSSATVVKRQVRLLDLMPTVLDICGCPLPSDLMGVSLVPLWTQRESEFKVETSISEMRRDPWHRIAVRTEAFKYIWDSKHPDKPNLYDLHADPTEMQNVSTRYPGIVNQFQAEVNAHLSRVAETEPLTPTPQLEHDQEVLTRLRDLGYIE